MMAAFVFPTALLPSRLPTSAVNTAAAFITPEMGIAGLTEGDARAQVPGHPEGMLKLVYDTRARAILGLHILAERAALLLGEGAAAVQAGLPIEALAAAIHPHPTLSEAIGFATRGERSAKT